MAYFPKYGSFFNFQKTPNFYKFEQRCQNERKLSVFRKFLKYSTFGYDVLDHIHQENLSFEQK